MSTDHKGFVQQFQRDIDTGKSSALDGYLVDGYVDHNPPPFASHAPGRTGVKETYDIALGIFSDFKHVVEDQVIDGDLVASRITGSGRHTGAFLGIPATNALVTMSGIAIHRVAGGQLVEHWGQVDAMSLLAQVGAFPAPPPAPPAIAPAIIRTAGDKVMSPDEVKRALRRGFEEGVNGRNREVWKELLHPLYVNYSMPSTTRGPEGMTAALDAFYAGFPDLQITLDAVLAEPDKGVTRGTATGTHQGSFMNVPGTGKTVRIPYIDMWVAYDGRFIENWVFMDMVGLLVQIGAMPAP